MQLFGQNNTCAAIKMYAIPIRSAAAEPDSTAAERSRYCRRVRLLFSMLEACLFLLNVNSVEN